MERRRTTRRRRFLFAALARHAVVLVGVIAALPAAAAAVQPAQESAVVGRVIDQGTNEPLAGVQVFIQGTSIGALSGADGRFSIPGVPTGVHTVVARRLGFRDGQQVVTVVVGEPVIVNLALSSTLLQLEEIVATGLADPVQGVRSPIAVTRVSREFMPVAAAGSSVQNLQGRVAGVRINRASGQPGSNVSIMLRTPTSLRGDTYPLIVVDGVILGGTGGSGTGLPSTVDLDALDIENIEVIRGAAASSLYGSRAASGVISITTARGQDVPLGQTRFTARSEYGASENLRNIALNNSHPYLMNAAGTSYVDTLGNEVGRDKRVAPPLSRAFMDQPYPDPIYDNIGAVTRAGGYINNSFQISGNTESTNFSVSLSNLKEQGTLIGNKGYERTALRVNLDHRFVEKLTLNVSMYHARDWRDNFFGTNPFDLVLEAPRDVDLRVKDENGNYIQQPNPMVLYQNPLWTQATRETDQKGTRTLVNMSWGWNPLSWLGASASVGYDRGDDESRVYVPKGTPANVGAQVQRDSINFTNNLRDTWNAEAQVVLRRDIGRLNARTTLRGVLERSDTESGTRAGSGFVLVGIPQLSAIPLANRNATSLQRQVRANGYLWDTALDYDAKYILTVLGRRDGSSLFGPDTRWHNYYRVAAAWRVGTEPWFNIPHVNEMKISFARGTAGGRPGINQQYETWSITEGIPTKGNLGNRMLRPEQTLEHEASLNLVLFDRFGIVLTHARQTTTDLLNPAPLPAITGYSTQWVNAGTLMGHSTEFEFEAQLIQRPKFGWTSMLVADYSNSKITEWTIPCYAQNWLWNCVDIPVYGLYSRWLVKSHSGLNQHDNGALLPYADEFEVNDEGFLVWVGQGNHYWEGKEKNLWGTSTVIHGQTYQWGHPFYELTEQGLPHRTLLGEGTPANIGWLNNIRIGAFTLHTQLHAAIGGSAYNRRHQLIGRTEPGTAPHLDQAGKPDALKKPIAYYRSAQDGDTSYAVEDASYLKLRTVSLQYRPGATTLERWGLRGLGIRDITLGLAVRNVFTITNYDGFDPEGALNLNDRTNQETSGYPPTRTLTAQLSVTF